MTDTPVVSIFSFDSSDFFTNAYHWVVGAYPSFVAGLHHLVGILVAISIPISILLFIGIIYCVEGLKKIRIKEASIHEPKLEVEPAFAESKPNPTLAYRWDNVAKHIASGNPNDWKQAIIEADIMLDTLLTDMGYRGESIGEKLKRVEPAQFETLNDAWEAHTVRNQIAHEGSLFNLNEHEAKRVIALYRKVFQEFYYI